METRVMHQDEDAARWAAVTARDSAADGRFVYAVRTTGVFCRPSCPSRPARRANVGFYADAAAARAAGFRPCLRCRPEGESVADRQAALVDRACRLIEAAEVEPDLAALAREAGLSRFHFHRLFKAALGVTPRPGPRRGRSRKPSTPAASNRAGASTPKRRRGSA